MGLNYVLLADKVKVLQECMISVGGTYRMNSSMGMAGIIGGIVKVKKIRLPEDMTEEERNHTIDSWDLYEPGDYGYWEHRSMLWEEPWVQYEYQNTEVLDEERVQWLPLEIFLDHKSTY